MKGCACRLDVSARGRTERSPWIASVDGVEMTRAPDGPSIAAFTGTLREVVRALKLDQPRHQARAPYAAAMYWLASAASDSTSRRTLLFSGRSATLESQEAT